ncbi:MAG: response regulator [Candidatus Gastranaerophilales bacterium]|nr:response regulator [Candidatus Gastranaerophilales bacterium]
MKKNILVVEDNELNMKLMVDILTQIGYSVQKAFDGEMALDILEKNDFDLMLLDIQLPKKSGYDVIKEMKKKVPTVIVSACCTEDEILKAKDKGCLDYITKPINISEFIQKINAYFSK